MGCFEFLNDSFLINLINLIKCSFFLFILKEEQETKHSELTSAQFN